MKAVALALVACAHAASPEPSSREDWRARANELCHVLGTDEARGIALAGVTFEETGRISTWDGVNGHEYTVTSPAYRSAAILADDQHRVVIASLQTTSSVDVICAGLGLAATAAGCTSAADGHTVRVAAERDGTRLMCRQER